MDCMCALSACTVPFFSKNKNKTKQKIFFCLPPVSCDATAVNSLNVELGSKL